MTENPTEEKYVVRFSRLNCTLHILMIVSFISFALTGLTLKFSYTGWAVVVSRPLGGFESAGYIHRVATVLMFGVFFTHLLDLVRLKREHYGSWRALLTGPDTMLPTKRDWQEFIGSLKWFLALVSVRSLGYGRTGKVRLHCRLLGRGGHRLNRTHALVLGVLHAVSPRLVHQRCHNYSHSDEALLAAGFIFTVHFFDTYLRPEKFPMDIVIFTGYISVEDFREDRPAEYQQLEQSGRLEEFYVQPYQPIVIRAIQIFAWTVLALGFSMILWIIYAMVFTYQ